MSLTEIPSQAAEFERTPPHDMAAEQCVIGGMLLSKDAISDVVEVLRPEDFYRPAHQVIFETVIDLYARGEPADPVTINAELTKRGELQRSGGAPYLHTLISSVPTAANAGYYAKIVRERAILRRLIEAGTRIVQLGYSADGEIDEAVDRAQAEVYNVTEHRTSEDYAALGEIMPGALDELEAIGSHGGAMVGVPTGFADLDALMNGLHPGQLVVVAARPAIGKALALDTPLPTPDGWTTMGEVSVGDQLLAADGTPTTVVAATDAMVGRPCYEVTFDDGTVIVADAEHRWLTDTRASRESDRAARAGYDRYRNQRIFPSIKTTAEIAKTLRCETADGGLNHSVSNAAHLSLPERDLPLPPYLIGAWLGDGDTSAARITTMDPEIVALLEGEGFRLTLIRGSGGTHSISIAEPAAVHQESVEAALRSLGVLGNKHIPTEYLRASLTQRRELLAGLLDHNGTVSRTGAVQFSVTNRRLADDVRELLVSLGYRCATSMRRVKGRSESSSISYTVTFTTADEVFSLPRKKIAHKERDAQSHSRIYGRFITDVRPIESVPVRCVAVDHPDHLYLASRSMIPTHNSTLGLDFARAAALHNDLTTVIYSLEMSRNEITMRLLSAESRVPLHTMRSGLMSDDDWTRLARRMSEVAEAPFFIDDSPNMSMMEIRAKCRRLKQRNDLRLIIVDYLQLMTSGKRVESRQVEVSEFSRSLKLLAKELDVPVIAISQLNRGPEQRTDKKPMLSDLRESGCVSAATRLMRADTNEEISLGELLESGASDVPVWALDERLKYVPRSLTHAFPSGRKELFRVRLASGREVEATANHPFLTLDGWVPLGQLGPNARVGVPRYVPPPLATRRMPEFEVILLAHLLGDGSFVKRQPIRYASRDEQNLEAVTEAARRFGVTAVRDDYAAARVTTLRLPAAYKLARGRRNPIAEWLDGLGLFGLRSHEKFVPAEVFRLPDDQIALFLRHLWSTDGSVTIRGNGGRIYYASTSRRMLEGISRLLLRFGIGSRLRDCTPGPHRPQYTLDISGNRDQLEFLRRVGVHGERSVSAESLLRLLEPLERNTNIDTIPREVWGRVRAILREKGITHRQFADPIGTQYCGSSLWKRCPSRGRLTRVAKVLEDDELELLATNDVFWDEIVEVENLGQQDVYDATVLGLHNFIANGIALHNSIEQDADVVILLHRDDAYEKESPRAGEADLVVAKHRNGPTATVTVAFQGHYSRFVDMATG